ncbi:MAG: bifunctional phosphoserine phosphatase/homoserine phosphotransferase ThrH [Desulfatibacillaceae bacterium]
MHLVCADLEGVFVPEIWINVAERTGIDKLRMTTRDISDYDELMGMRIEVMRENNLKLKDVTDVIATMDPLPGAREFLDWVRSQVPLIIVSDTFTQFAGPLMEKLGRPALFCNTLVIDEQGAVSGYQLRQQDGKRHVARALKSLNFTVTAMGDSYNDTTMLMEADNGILFRPPQNVIDEFPQFPVVRDYDQIRGILGRIFAEQQ